MSVINVTSQVDPTDEDNTADFFEQRVKDTIQSQLRCAESIRGKAKSTNERTALFTSRQLSPETSFRQEAHDKSLSKNDSSCDLRFEEW